MRRGGRWRAALAVLAAASPGPSCAFVRWKVRDLARDNPRVLYSVDTTARAVALTIDDGPDPATTPPILEVLERHEARATFFVITSRIPGNEELLRHMVAAGHELGNHMLRDEPSIELKPEEFERQLAATHETLARFGPIRWFRPGSGRHDADMLAAIEPYGYRCALGSVYPFDPQIRWSWFSRRFILSNVRPGAVVILHDWGSKGRRTAATLAKVLPALGKRGYRVLTLSELDALRTATPTGAAIMRPGGRSNDARGIPP